MRKPHTACYWLVGAANRRQPPAVAVDLHDADGELIGSTFTRSLKPLKARRAAQGVAVAFARLHGVPASRVVYDGTSTEFFANV